MSGARAANSTRNARSCGRASASASFSPSGSAAPAAAASSDDEEEEEELEEEEESDGDANGGAAGFSTEQLAQLKVDALERFAVISSQFDRMRKAAYGSAVYQKAQATISAAVRAGASMPLRSASAR